MISTKELFWSAVFGAVIGVTITMRCFPLQEKKNNGADRANKQNVFQESQNFLHEHDKGAVRVSILRSRLTNRIKFLNLI